MTHNRVPLNAGSPPQGQDGKEDEKPSQTLSKIILKNIRRAYAGAETSKFIQHLGETLQAPEPERLVPAGLEEDPEFKCPAPFFLDRLFDEFDRYSFEFAKTPAATALTVECQRPVSLKESLAVAPGETPVLVEGTLLAGNWTMILQAQERLIRAYVVPSDYVDGFHARQSFYSPFMEIEAFPQGGQMGQMRWKLDNDWLTAELMPKFSKQLFGALLKVTGGEVNNTERFRLEPANNQSIGRLLPQKDEKLALQMAPESTSITFDSGSRQSLEVQLKKDMKETNRAQLHANKIAVLSLLESVIPTLDNEINRLNRLEQEANRLADSKAAEQAVLRSKQLRYLSERLTTMVGDWRTLSSS